MPSSLVKFNVSPAVKPVPTVTVAPAVVPPLSGAVMPIVRQSTTADPPPLNVTVPPVVIVGATCTTSSVLLPVLLIPLLVLPSLTTQSIVRLVSPPPLVGSPLVGVKL